MLKSRGTLPPPIWQEGWGWVLECIYKTCFTLFQIDKMLQPKQGLPQLYKTEHDIIFCVQPRKDLLKASVFLWEWVADDWYPQLHINSLDYCTYETVMHWCILRLFRLKYVDTFTERICNKTWLSKVLLCRTLLKKVHQVIMKDGWSYGNECSIKFMKCCASTLLFIDQTSLSFISDHLSE